MKTKHFPSNKGLKDRNLEKLELPPIQNASSQSALSNSHKTPKINSNNGVNTQTSNTNTKKKNTQQQEKITLHSFPSNATLQVDQDFKEQLGQSASLNLSQTNLGIANSQGIEEYLHRSRMSLDVAEQMKKLNEKILSTSFQGQTIHTNKNNTVNKNMATQFSEIHPANQKNGVEGNADQPNNELNSNYQIGKISNSTSQPILCSSQLLNDIAIKNTNNAPKKEDLTSKSEVKLPSVSFFGLTSGTGENISEHQRNLLRALNLCNASTLDKIVERTQVRQKQQSHEARRSQQVQQNEAASILEANHLSRKGSLPFKISALKKEAEDQSYRAELENAQKPINRAKFYAHFNEGEGLEDYSKRSQSLNNLQNPKPRFLKVSTIRPDIVYNVKQLVRLQRRRDEKQYMNDIKPQEMIEYMKQRNQIEVILESSKKIKNLKVVADVIEQEIAGQNDKISNIVDDLVLKFDLKAYLDAAN